MGIVLLAIWLAFFGVLIVLGTIFQDYLQDFYDKIVGKITKNPIVNVVIFILLGFIFVGIFIVGIFLITRI